MIIKDEEAAVLSVSNQFFLNNVDLDCDIHVARCAPEDTHFLTSELTLDGFPAFNPLYSFDKRVSRHSKKTTKTHSLFFPSYLFITYGDYIEQYRGKLSFLKFGDLYATLPCKDIVQFNEVIVKTRNREESFLVGDKVRVLSGAFYDMEAIIVKSNNKVASLKFGISELIVENFPLDSVTKKL